MRRYFVFFGIISIFLFFLAMASRETHVLSGEIYLPHQSRPVMTGDSQPSPLHGSIHSDANVNRSPSAAQIEILPVTGNE